MTEGVLVLVDVQHVFADRDSPWGAPRFAEVHPAIRRLTAAFAGRVVHTRFVAPAEPVAGQQGPGRRREPQHPER